MSDPSSNSMLWKQGGLASTVKAQNRAVASWLPERNSGFCQATTDFLKYLLGVAPINSIYPPDPTDEEISRLPSYSINDIGNNLSVFSVILPENSIPMEDSLLPRRSKSCWIHHKQYFLLDLNQNGISSAKLQLKTRRPSSWNAIILTLAVKHLKWARERGAFSNYALDPRQNDELMTLAVLE